RCFGAPNRVAAPAARTTAPVIPRIVAWLGRVTPVEGSSLSLARPMPSPRDLVGPARRQGGRTHAEGPGTLCRRAARRARNAVLRRHANCCAGVARVR